MLRQFLYIFQFTSLKLIANYCIKHWAFCVNNLYILWAMIHILPWTTKKHQQTLSRLLHSKLKKIQVLFKDFHRISRKKMTFRDFSRLCEPSKLKQKHIINNPVHGFCFEINHIIDHYRLLPTATFSIDLVLFNGEINICSKYMFSLLKY